METRPLFTVNDSNVARAQQKLAAIAGGAPGTATPQEKILSVADELGIRGMEIMQATTRTIYDSLSMATAGTSVYKFFDGCNARAFPATNLPSNRLEVGEAMILESLTISTYTSAAPPAVTAVGNLSATSTSYYQSEWSFTVANSVVVKPVSLLEMFAPFNQNAHFLTNDVFNFRSLITIPSLQQFIATWQVADTTARANTFACCKLTGLGVIYRPKRAL